MSNSLKTILVALLLTLTLTACQTKEYIAVAVPEGTKMPEITAELREACDIPGIKAGDDVRLLLAEHRAELLICADRHGGLVQFYDAVKEIINKPVELR